MVSTAVIVWLALTIAVEFMVDIIKQIFPFLNTKISHVDIERLLALGIGLGICFGASIDFFSMIGIDYAFPYVGPSISALFVAGGSGKLHDFIKAIATVAEQYKESVQKEPVV